MKRFFKKKFVIPAVVLIVAVIAYFILSNRGIASTTRYVTGLVQKGTVSSTISSTGNIQSGKTFNGVFKVSGRIIEIYVNVGDTVKVGQKLMKIDDTTLRNTLAQSESQLNQANNNLSNLYLKGGRSTTYLDIANQEESVKTAQLKYNTDLENLNNATLVSTVDGIVSSIVGGIGDQTGSAASVTVIDPKQFYVNVTAGEIDSGKLKIGMLAQLEFDALGGKQYVGKITMIDVTPTIQSNVVSYSVRVSITAVDSDLKLGLSATATIDIASKEEVLYVTNSAIKSLGSQKYVQILENGLPTNMNVTIGLVGDTTTEIVEGLKEGDSIITSTVSSSTSSSTTRTNNAISIPGLGGAGQRGF